MYEQPRNSASRIAAAAALPSAPPQAGTLSVAGIGKAGEVRVVQSKLGNAETFQWVDLRRGDTLPLSLTTNRYLVAPKTPGAVAADHPGPAPDRKDGSCFSWSVVR